MHSLGWLENAVLDETVSHRNNCVLGRDEGHTEELLGLFARGNRVFLGGSFSAFGAHGKASGDKLGCKAVGSLVVLSSL